MPGREPPPIDLPEIPLRAAENAKRDVKDPMHWAYGSWAGGWRLDFGMYEGEFIREVPYYDYLKFCQNRSRGDRANFHYALHTYSEGLMEQADKCPGNFIVPFNGQNTGRCIRECEEHYLRWLLYSKPKTDNEKEKYGLFYLAIHNFLNKPSPWGPVREQEANGNDSDEESNYFSTRDDYGSDRGSPPPPAMKNTPRKSSTPYYQEIKRDNAYNSPLYTGLLTPEKTPAHKQYAKLQPSIFPASPTPLRRPGGASQSRNVSAPLPTLARFNFKPQLEEDTSELESKAALLQRIERLERALAQTSIDKRLDRVEAEVAAADTYKARDSSTRRLYYEETRTTVNPGREFVYRQTRPWQAYREREDIS